MTFKQQWRHASPNEGCAIRVRMSRDKRTAKVERDVRFFKLSSLVK